MELNFACLFDNASADFQESILNRIELSSCPRRAIESLCPQGVEQHVSGAMQKESELVCFESVARCSIGVKEGFVILDEAFHTSPSTVDAVVDKLRSTAL